MTTTLGKQGLTVSNIGFAGMGVTSKFGNRLAEKDALKIFRALHHWGCRFYDTAAPDQSGNIFARRLHETITGKFISTVSRDSLKVATRFNPDDFKGVCDTKTVTAAVDASLEKLGVAYIDLYYISKMPETQEKLIEFMEACGTLVDAGKIKYVGLMYPNAQWIRAAHEVHPISVIQDEWSIIVRDAEVSILPLCRELDIGFVAFSPLARKLFNTTDSKVLSRNRGLIAALTALAEAKNVTTTQVALAWVYRQAITLGVNVVAIPGTSNINHARQNITALQINLTEANMAAITLSLEETATQQKDTEADSGPPPSFTR